MTKDDLKHALISLVLGILITALTSLLTGLMGILQHWIADLAGGATATISYLQQTYKC